MKKSADQNSDKMKAEFRHKLENYKATPSENLWDKIELSLDKEEALVYKNRFRVYSRLAAACLALLIAFAVIFVPRKWEQLQNQEAEIAAAKTSPANKVNTETKAPISAGKNLPETKLSQESLAFNTPKRNTKQQPETGNLPSEPGKTVGVKAEKVPVKQTNPDLTNLVAANTSKSASRKSVIGEEPELAKQPSKSSAESVSASKTGLEEVTLAAVSPEETNPETSEAMPETTKIQNAEVASSFNVTRSEVKAGNESNNNLTPQKATVASNISSRSASSKTSPKVKTSEVISDQSQTRTGTFSDQKPGVSEAAKTENSVALTGKKEDEIPQTNLAQAQEPAKEEVAVLTEGKSEEKKKASEKASRWMVSGSYAALSFNSGIRLAGRSFEPEQQGAGSGGNYNQNIYNYQTAIQEYNHETSAAYSQKGGVLVGFKLAKKWLLQTGFSYFQNREKTNSSYVFARNPGYGGYPGQISLTTDSGTPTTLETVLSDNFDPVNSQVSPASDYTTLYSYQFYSLPLNLRFQTGEPGIYYFAGAGGSVNFLDQSTVEIQETTVVTTSMANARTRAEKGTQPDVYRNSLLSVQLETGLGYSFSSHWSAEFALTGNRFLKPLIREEQLTGAKQQTARSFGAALNLGYTF